MLDPKERFEILGTIAAGDFATVLRARDRELGREVAIKQIHAQFLQDPRQLDRYWKEAQLLASLEHPHIMMIYDIVRDRGWLVLELMQGSLQQLLGGRPIDLNDLRMALTYIAHALQFMHQNGIIHGDVKPSNLLVDKNHRVKLGDFGIARRISGDHGSVVKGTTKYMAPEVVSDQFGPVGPHSDLYSLGFSAYELLCGENFETLFPGLNMFGRDRQMAWLMWHSAPDRRLPDINRVLQGVPPDLAFIIQKLIEKDPAKRYRSASQLIEDLRQQATCETGPTEEELAAAARAERQAKRRRWLSIGACVVSMGLSVAMLWPSKPPPVIEKVETPPSEGVIDELDFNKTTFFLKQDETLAAKGIMIDPEVDRIFVNEEKAAFADLRHNDRVTIKYLKGDGAEFLEVYATRPQEQHLAGRIAEVSVASAELRLADEEGQPPQEPWYVPADTPVTVNEQRAINNRVFTLADLRADDRVTVSYVVEQDGRRVTRAIVALRTLQAQGSVVSRNPQQGKITLKDLSGKATREYTIARDCIVTLNGQDKVGDVPVTIADLVPGDDAVFTFDTVVHGIVARRDVSATGVIANIQTSQRNFTVEAGTPPKELQFALGATCEIFGPGNKPLEFDFLRAGDRVTVDFAPLEGGKLQAVKIVAQPAADSRTWAIVISGYQYDDARLAALPYGAADLAILRDVFLLRYRVPPEQLLVLENNSRLQVEQGLTAFLGRVPADAQLICYYEGHAVVDKMAGPILTTKEFDSARASETGLAMRSLVSQLEQCSAREKILLLDSCHGAAAETEPSAAEQAEAAKTKPNRPVSTNVLVIASCDKQQRGLATADGAQGVFAAAVASAFGGGADVNRDGRVAVAELLEFLPKAMTAAAGPGKAQTPVVFTPVNKPPRLTTPAQEVVRNMLGHLRGTRWDEAFTGEFQQGEPQLQGQPDLALAFGLVLLRNNRTPLSRPVFERVRNAHPKSVVAHQALAWQSFQQGRFADGVADLRLMVDNLPDVKVYPAADRYFKYSLTWAGALREFALSAAENHLERKDVEELDKAVIARGDEAKEAYRQGVESTRMLLAKIDEEMPNAPPERRAMLQLDRKRIAYYTQFQFPIIAEYMRLALED